MIRRGFEKDDVEIVSHPGRTVKEGARNVVQLGDEKFELGFQMAASRDEAGDAEGLTRNLEKLAVQAKAAGTMLVFMSYPARYNFYGRANPIIWETAAKTGTPVINLTEVFQPICPEEECLEYLLWDNNHPNIKGYRVVAEMITAQLLPLLNADAE